MKIKLLLTFLGISILAISCKKNPTEEIIANQDINTLVVPANFNWQTARDVKFNIAIHDARFQNSILHVLEVFIGDPANGGASIAKGAVSLNSAFKFRAEIPAMVNEVYVMKTAPDGSKFIQKVVLNSTDISLSIGSASITQSISAVGLINSRNFSLANVNIPVETSPNSTAGCNTEISESSHANVNLKDETVCVTGNNLNVKINNPKGGTLRIYGTGTVIDNLNLDADVNIIVTSTGSLTIKNLTFDGGVIKNFGALTLTNVTIKGTVYNAGTLNTSDLTVESGVLSNTSTINVNGNTKVKATFNNTGRLNTKEFTLEGSVAKVSSSGTLDISSNINVDGTFENSGDIIVKGVYNSNNKPTFTNSGKLTVTGNMTIAGTYSNTSTGVITANGGDVNLNDNIVKMTNSGIFIANNARMVVKGTVINDGSITSKHFTINSGLFTNNCKLIVHEDFIHDGASINNSYIQVGVKSNIKNIMTLNNGAMFQTKTLESLDGKVIGTGNTSLFRVTNLSSGGVNGRFEGTLRYCDANRTLADNKFSDKNIQGCDIYIAKTDCMPEGYGTAPAETKSDTDGDGVIDAEDDYPTIKEKAFDIYSVNYENGGGTIAFEDSWPKKGDYDLNDVIISYRYKVVTNAANKVVQVNADYKLIASGGNYQNGAGIQFNIPSDHAKNFEGTNGTALENGQDSVVVVLFKNSRNEQINWNTIPSAAVSEATAYSFSFDVIDGPTLLANGIGTYNPFIWNNGIGRGHETHLYGKNPTKLGNTFLFGTEDDNSAGGKYYTTKIGLPWAIAIPTVPFQYPVETVAVTDTYLRFADWATSGGKTSQDWYSNTVSGYRNTNNIYVK